MAWQAAVGTVDITPEAGLTMGGFGTDLGAQPRTATDTFSPLLARAVVLWDSGVPYVLVSADLLGWPATAAATIRRRLAASPHLPRARLMLAASHTHNGPALPESLNPFMTYGLTDTTPLESYQGGVIGAVVQLVRNLVAGPRIDVTVDYRATEASFSANREGLPYDERAVPVLVARQADGHPLAVLFGYGAHPVSAGIQTEWDGDYPAAAAAAIEAVFPDATAVFLPGAAGDQNPVGDSGWALRHACGADLASAVAAVAATPGAELTSITQARCSTVELPLEVTLTPDNLAVVRDLYAQRGGNPGLPGWVVRHAQVMVDLLDSGEPIATAVPVPLDCWLFDGAAPLRLAFAGGEIVSGYAVAMRQRFGGPEGIWLGGYGAALQSYLPSDALLPPLRVGGSYGGGWDPDFPGIAGGSMCIYGPLGHYRSGPDGIEPTLIGALESLLS